MFQPMLGDTFEIVTATADVTGRFSVTDLQPLGGGLRGRSTMARTQWRFPWFQQPTVTSTWMVRSTVPTWTP